MIGNRKALLQIIAAMLALMICLTLPAFADTADIYAQNTPPSMPNGQTPPAMPDEQMGMGGAQGMELTGAYTVDGTAETGAETRYVSFQADENAVLVKNGGTFALSGAAVEKNGDTSSADDSNFYGLNAGIAVQAGSTAELSGLTVTTTGEGSNAVFATGEGAAITIADTTIKTAGNSARGLDATYGGTINASNMTIETSGAHCAPIATDRGEGTVTVDSATLKASGDGSPCVYSTGDITLSHVSGTAADSQACVIEGKNKITMTDCDLTGAGLNGVMLYQSTSGDAAVGASVLTCTDSRLATTSNGPMFYVTNTEAEIDLENTELVFSSGILIKASGNSTNNWGTPGSNGGNLTMNAKNQTLKGLIVCDEISGVTVTLGEGAVFEGAVDAENTGSCSLTVLKDATFTLTADCYLDSFVCDGTLNLNGHNIHLADGTIL